MLPEGLFRFLLLAILLPALFTGVYHRRRASTGERLDRRQEGLFILIALRLSGLAMWSSVLAWLIWPRAMEWSRWPMPGWLRLAGFFVGVPALAWLIWVFRTLGRNITDTVVTRKQHSLVTGGPYRWVRHPLYTAIVPLGLAVSLLASNWFMVTMAAAAFVLLAVRTGKEEANLVVGFGEEYRDYMARTGKFLPRLGR